jgi:hypothetical protein
VAIIEVIKGRFTKAAIAIFKNHQRASCRVETNLLLMEVPKTRGSADNSTKPELIANCTIFPARRSPQTWYAAILKSRSVNSFCFIFMP